MFSSEIRRLGRLWTAICVFGVCLAWGEREAAADVSTRYDYEVLILRLDEEEDDATGVPEVCRWWYLVWEAGSWSLFPIVPEGWLQAYNCDGVALFGGGASEAGQ